MVKYVLILKVKLVKYVKSMYFVSKNWAGAVGWQFVNLGWGKVGVAPQNPKWGRQGKFRKKAESEGGEDFFECPSTAPW